MSASKDKTQDSEDSNALRSGYQVFLGLDGTIIHMPFTVTVKVGSMHYGSLQSQQQEILLLKLTGREQMVH